jgi:YD repeat-containing protein
VVHIVDQTLTFVDNHPEVVDQLTGTLQNVGGAVGGVVGNVVGAVEGLLLSTTKLANGNTLQHVIDQATGNLVDKTLSTAGKLVAQKVVGNVLQLPTLNEVTNAAGNVVRQVRDQSGKLIEYTLDKATNKLAGIRLLNR